MGTLGIAFVAIMAVFALITLLGGGGWSGTHTGTETSGDSPRRITWSVAELPEVRHGGMVVSGVARGFETWEQHNPKLDFERVGSGGNIEVRWEVEPSGDGHVGVAEYGRPYSGTITVHLGDYDCNGRYVQWGQDAVTDTAMHEIGHILGLEHAADESHLMYGHDFVQEDFQTRGYNIPSSLDARGLFVGEDALWDRLGELDTMLAPLDARLAELDRQYVRTIEQWGMTVEEYEASGFVEPGLYNEITPTVDEYNGLVAEREPMSDEYNDLVEAVNCYHAEPRSGDTKP